MALQSRKARLPVPMKAPHRFFLSAGTPVINKSSSVSQNWHFLFHACMHTFSRFFLSFSRLFQSRVQGDSVSQLPIWSQGWGKRCSMSACRDIGKGVWLCNLETWEGAGYKKPNSGGELWITTATMQQIVRPHLRMNSTRRPSWWQSTDPGKPRNCPVFHEVQTKQSPWLTH